MARVAQSAGGIASSAGDYWLLNPRRTRRSPEFSYVTIEQFAVLLTDVEGEVQKRVREEQGGVPTFFDALALSSIERLREADTPEQPGNSSADTMRGVFLRYEAARRQARHVLYAERSAESAQWAPLPWETTRMHLTAMQGVRGCVTWRGRPLFKTAFDLALYPMLLWEVRPAAIFELGSGTGASAIWLADLLTALGIPARVYSVDLDKPTLDAPSQVSFIEGDCRNIEAVLPRTTLERLPHPWILIEDAHVDTLNVLRHFAASARPGDYFIVEDSYDKQPALAEFARETSGAFMVDTHYADFFGRNATCSIDSIFVRVPNAEVPED